MKEWIRKDEVLDLLRSLPHDIVDDHIFELKGIWADEDFNRWNSPDNPPDNSLDHLLKILDSNNTEWHVIAYYDPDCHCWYEHRECIPIDREDIVGWMPIPE